MKSSFNYSIKNRISSFSLEINERENAKALVRNLDDISNFQFQFENCLNLFNFCTDHAINIKNEIPIASSRPDIFWDFLEWRKIAARDGVFAIVSFKKSMTHAINNLDFCNYIKSIVDKNNLKNIIDDFNNNKFPNNWIIRNAVAHPYDISGTVSNFNKNGNKHPYNENGIKIDETSTGNIINGMAGDKLIVTKDGHIHEYEISQLSLDKLNEARLAFFADFEIVGKLTTDHLCKYGTAGAMANPLSAPLA